jgi:hypothetical protein
MRSCRSPGIELPVYDSEARVRDVKPSILVDGGGVWRSRDIESFYTDYGFVGESIGTRYQREDVFGNTRAGLQESPLCADL